MRLIYLVAAVLSAALSAQPALAEVAAVVETPGAIAAPADLPRGKLADAVTPLAYRLDLTVDPAAPRFSGRVEIDVTLRQPAATLFLHGRDLAMHRAEARIGGKVYPGRWRQAEATGVAVLAFDQPLPAGPATLAFDYDAAFADSPSGLYRVKMGGEFHVWSQFQSIDGRAAFPAFDQPGFKTPFAVTLRTPPGLVALSNAPAAAGPSREGGLDVHRFIPTLPLPTYLVAVVVGPFAVLEGEVPPTPQRAGPLPLRIVATRQNADKLAFALQGSKEIVAHLEAYFDDAFPYPKLDQIGSPVMPGAMENAGADIYGDNILLLDDTASVSARRRFGMVVAHELAHQWFGDLVTPAWWDDIWLNESFANWMGYRIGDAWRPALNIRAGALEEGFQAMATDALGAGRPIRQDITENGQIDAAFDAITYGKGGHVVGMIAGYMGDEKFRDGVRRYMRAHRNGNATSADFFAAMAEAAGNPAILPAMQGFVGQQGVPLITFTGRKGRYAITQGRYAGLGTVAPETRWTVPLCIRQEAQRQCSLLTGAGDGLELPGKAPFMPNAGGTGYYRFELPRRDWNRLIAVADRLPGGEALALADSLEASFRAGRASLPQLAALARKLVRNPDSYASAAATRALRSLWSSGVIGDEASPAMQRFMLGLHAPLLRKYGFDPRAGAYAGEDPDQTQKRLQIVSQLSGRGRDPALTARLAEAARARLGGERQALDPMWFELAFEAHLDAGGAAAARALVDLALASEDPQFRPVALEAAAASGRPEVARWLLEELKDPRLRESERRAMVGTILQIGTTRDYGYGWLQGNLDGLLAGSGGIFFRSRMADMLSGFCSVDRAEDIARDFRGRLAGSGGELALERTIERVRNCGMLKDARGYEATRDARRLH